MNGVGGGDFWAGNAFGAGVGVAGTTGVPRDPCRRLGGRTERVGVDVR